MPSVLIITCNLGPFKKPSQPRGSHVVAFLVAWQSRTTTSSVLPLSSLGRRGSETLTPTNRGYGARVLPPG